MVSALGPTGALSDGGNDGILERSALIVPLWSINGRVLCSDENVKLGSTDC